MRFAPKPNLFLGAAATEEDADAAGLGLPEPIKVAIKVRRMAGLAAMRDSIRDIPAPNESVHLLCTARMNLTDGIEHLIQKLGTCRKLVIATLGYNRDNLGMILGWLDHGQVESLYLLASKFFRAHNGDLWEETQEEIVSRKQHTACAPTHAKVVTMEFDSCKLVFEGSANLGGNGDGWEQLALINSAELHEWHTKWIVKKVLENGG